MGVTKRRCQKGIKKVFCALLAAGLLVTGADSYAGNLPAADAATQTQKQGREVLNFNTDWLYSSAENIDAIVCANDEMALAVVETLKAEGLNGKIKVTGFDGIQDAVSAIQAGDMYGTVGANPYIEGGLGIAYLYDCWSGNLDLDTLEEGQRSFLTEPELITVDTVEEFVNKEISLDFENYMSMAAEEIDLRSYK